MKYGVFYYNDKVPFALFDNLFNANDYVEIINTKFNEEENRYIVRSISPIIAIEFDDKETGTAYIKVS